MEETLNKLIEYVETAAPITWEIALRQVGVQVVQIAIALGVLVLILGVCTVLLIKYWNHEDEDNDHSSRYMLMFFITVCLIVIVPISAKLIGSIMNPEFYAIKILMDLAGL